MVMYSEIRVRYQPIKIDDKKYVFVEVGNTIYSIEVDGEDVLVYAIIDAINLKKYDYPVASLNEEVRLYIADMLFVGPVAVRVLDTDVTVSI
jgi:hypothetical protein